MSSATEQTLLTPMTIQTSEIPVSFDLQELTELESILAAEAAVIRMFAREGLAPDAHWRGPLVLRMLAKIQNANQ